jgi:hypothetical protein
MLLAFLRILQYNNSSTDRSHERSFGFWGLVQHLNSEVGSVLNSPQEIEREIAVIRVLASKGDITGENFVTARRKLLAEMLRPHDIHKVEVKARELYAKGTIFMRGRTLMLDVAKATTRVDCMMNSIEGNHPTCRNWGDALKEQIRTLAAQLTTLDQSSQLALA